MADISFKSCKKSELKTNGLQISNKINCKPEPQNSDNSFISQEPIVYEMFNKKRIFIETENNVYDGKLANILKELNAYVLHSFDDKINYVITSNKKLNIVENNKSSKKENNIPLKRNLNGLSTNFKPTARQQIIQKMIDKSIKNQNSNSSAVKHTVTQDNSFLVRVKNLGIPILSSKAVWAWLNKNCHMLIKNFEYSEENTSLDFCRAVKGILEPALKIYDKATIFKPDFKSKCHFFPYLWIETNTDQSDSKNASSIDNSSSKNISVIKADKTNKTLKPNDGVKVAKNKANEGYCELCEVQYKDTYQHLNSNEHSKFANDSKIFADFDDFRKGFSDFDSFFSVRLRKQTILERNASRKLIKQLSVNDFKTNLIPSPESETKTKDRNMSVKDSEEIVKETSGVLENTRPIDLNSVKNIKEQVIMISKLDVGTDSCIKMNIKPSNNTYEEPTVLIIPQSSELAVLNASVKMKKTNTKEEPNVIMVPQPSEVVPDSGLNLKVIPSNNAMEEPSVIISTKPSAVSTDSCLNLKIKPIKKGRITKKKTRLSLSLKKPLIGKLLKDIFEEVTVLPCLFTCQKATIELFSHFNVAQVLLPHLYASTFTTFRPFEETQEISPIFTISPEYTINPSEIHAFNETTIIRPILHTTLQICTDNFNICQKMVSPEIVSNCLAVNDNYLNSLGVTIINSQYLLSEYSSLDQLFYRPSVSSTPDNESKFVSVNSLTTFEAEIVENFNKNEEEEEISDNSEAESVIEPTILDNSFGSSISLEMPSSINYDFKFDTTPESSCADKSPVITTYKHHVFSPYILRSIQNSEELGCSPQYTCSPVLYGDSVLDFDNIPTTSVTSSFITPDNHKLPRCRKKNASKSVKQDDNDCVLDLKQLISSDSYLFDVLSKRKLRSQPKLLLSIDSLIENHFRNRFDLDLHCSSEKEIVNNNSNKIVNIESCRQKRRRPHDDSPSDFSCKRKRSKKNESIYSDDSHCYMSESPISRRPFRQAKYIARETISMSTQLYFN